MQQPPQDDEYVPVDLSGPDVLHKGDHHAAAKSFRKNARPVLTYYRGNWFDYVGHEYNHVTVDRVESDLKDYLRNDVVGAGNVDFKVNRAVLREVMAELQAACSIPPEQRAPFWRKPVDAELPPDLPPAVECIALKNCIVHAPTGKRLESDMRFFTRNTLQFDYDPEAQCARWRGCLVEWFDDVDDALRLQEFFGYCMLPSTNLQKFFLLLGTGGNGKLQIVAF